VSREERQGSPQEGCEKKLRCPEDCQVPYRTTECVENIFRTMESYEFFEKISPQVVRRKFEEWEVVELYGFEYQFELLAKIAYLTFSPKIRRDIRDMRPIMVLVFGYPGTGKTPLLYLLLKKILEEYEGEIEIIEAIRVNCQRLVSLLEPERVKEVLRKIEYWIDRRGHYTILFLDEAEGIAFERGTEKASARRELTFWVMSLWDRKKRLLIVLVTNYPDLVDEAIRNRADFVVYFTPVLGRNAIRKSLRTYVAHFWKKELLSWASWNIDCEREEKRLELRKKLMEIVEEIVKEVFDEDECITKALEDLAEELAKMSTECACNPRNLYEGIKMAVKFYMCVRSGELAAKYPDVLVKEARRRSGQEVEPEVENQYKEVKEVLKGFIKDFIKNKLKTYIYAFGGVFPLYSDVAGYEDRYCSIIMAARRSMQHVVKIFDEIEETMLPRCIRDKHGRMYGIRCGRPCEERAAGGGGNGAEGAGGAAVAEAVASKASSRSS